MNKIKVFKIISTAFRLFLIFALSFVWMRYFFKDLILAILFTIFLTAILDLLIFVISRRRESNLNLKAKELKEADDMFLSLIIVGPMSFLKELASSRHKCKSFKDYLLITEGGSHVVLFPHFSMNPLNPDDVMKIYKKILQKCNKLVIITGTVLKETYSFASKINFNILILDKDETYQKLYKEYKIFPKIREDLKPVKNETIKTLIAYSFNKKRTKSYLFSSIILLFSSFVVESNVYYIVMSSLLLVFALVSFYNPVFNKKQFKNILTDL